ncbi:EamA family transporter [Tunturiibacter gelidiferens]|uniref:EamA family transporter n=1 Tax=Tunturiibacter gelidiferens TaxID=3069689 RepID=UPI003D9B8112
MQHTLTPRRWLVLIAVMLGASIGDALLGIGMKQLGPVSLNHLGALFFALKSPWIISGILVLLGFMACYMTALSWADITFVLPATAFGNVIVTILSRFWLHEHVSRSRWLGVALIVIGVGFVANGPSRTEYAAVEVEVLP